jgi:hypothetical protein
LDGAVTPSLAQIAALARAGAVDSAWTGFVAGGHDRSTDPRALVLGGRLLKDRAAQAEGTERRRLYGEAARAYAGAAGAEQATYPLINAATLSLLSGDRDAARSLAEQTLRRIADQPDEPETPYWRAATEAEALLLLDRRAQAEAALSQARSLAPRAWEDHASTLRQFALILGEQGWDLAWLDPLRPPRSLHFGGHMAFSGERGRPALIEQIEADLEEEGIGFGYGALAAGADIIVAEALLARGAELHLVLPGGAEAFAARSVDPFGESWRRRFDAVVERAEDARPIRPFGVEPELATISVSDEVAMGAALMNARRLESEAVQLLVLDEEPARRRGGAAARAGSRWAEGGWRQRIIHAPRDAAAAAAAVPAAAASGTLRPLAMLAIAVEAEAGGRLEALRDRLGEGASCAVGPYWSGGQVVAAWSCCREAGEIAVRLAGAGYRVGGDYRVGAPFAEPFSASPRLPAAVTAAASAAAASTPAGSACVTGDFAAALTAAGPDAPSTELVGELDPVASGAPLDLFALRRRS